MTIGRIPSVEGGIQPTIVDAKGDLIVATAADQVNRLAVGSNDQILVADSTATSGVAWKSYGGQLSASNPVINGAFDIWQRGTSTALAASTSATYISDRWQSATGANQASTFSRQATNDTTNLPNIQYCLRLQRNSGQTGTGGYALVSNQESVNSIPFAGKTITFSFYARKGADFSPTSGNIAARLITGTGTDQSLWSGFTGGSNLINQTTTLTTTWQRFSYTATMSASATQIGIEFDWTPTGTAGTNDYWEITGVQIDVGSTALPFRRSENTIQGELAACQRYYWRITGSDGNNCVIGNGVVETTGQFDTIVNHPTAMRVVPTSIDYSGTRVISIGTSVATVTTPTSVTLPSGNSSTTKSLVAWSKASSFTIGHTGWFSLNGSSDYFGLSAEL